MLCHLQAFHAYCKSEILRGSKIASTARLLKRYCLSYEDECHDNVELTHLDDPVSLFTQSRSNTKNVRVILVINSNDEPDVGLNKILHWCE